MRKCKTLPRWIPSMVMATMLLVFSLNVSATENVGAVDSVSGGDVINMVLPAVPEGEKSPFDFILDPQGLIYETDAARYGGGRVEEGATLLFCNREGEFNFSRFSDKLTVINQSTVPAVVTISAYVSGFEGIDIVESNDFSGDEACSLYLAIVDDKGNEQSLSAEGKVSIDLVMDAASDGGTVTYSFGLTGACNPNADWQGMVVHPVVTVTWSVETVPTEKTSTVVQEQAAPQENISKDGAESDRTEEHKEPENEEDMEIGAVSGNHAG